MKAKQIILRVSSFFPDAEIKITVNMIHKYIVEFFSTLDAIFNKKNTSHCKKRIPKYKL